MVLSTNRNYEYNAEAEFWFEMLLLGELDPIIIHSAVPGIILSLTKTDPFEIIHRLRLFLERDPDFIQYICRMVPIEICIETDFELIIKSVKDLLASKSDMVKDGTFAIKIRKRSFEIKRSQLVEEIAADIHNPVNLKNPDWIVWIEIIGNSTGISILKPDDVLSVVKLKKTLISTDFPDYN